MENNHPQNMELVDYFASQAIRVVSQRDNSLCGLLKRIFLKGIQREDTPEYVAKKAWEYAYAMMIEKRRNQINDYIRSLPDDIFGIGSPYSLHIDKETGSSYTLQEKESMFYTHTAKPVPIKNPTLFEEYLNMEEMYKFVEWVQTNERQHAILKTLARETS